MAVTESIIETLDHRVMQAHAFALLDPMQVEPEARDDLTVIPLVPKRHAAQSHLFPLLVSLAALSDTTRAGLIERMDAWQGERGTPFFSALLACDEAPETLARHLTRRSDARLPSGARDVLRLHDPRVIRHVRWILQPQQLAALCGSVRAWSWPEPDGSWHCLQPDEPRVSSWQRPLNLTQVQWARLNRIPAMNAVVNTLVQTSDRFTDDTLLARQVDRRLAEAEQSFPGSSRDDHTLYAEHVLRFGVELYWHADIRSRMARVEAGETTYFAAFARFEDADLEAMAATVTTARKSA